MAGHNAAMTDRLLADLTLLLHLAFVLFVLLGGALVLWRWRLAWLHLPALLWGILVELTGWICPLTYLEHHWRRQAGLAGYEGGFIEHYLVPLIYPPGLSRAGQVTIGVALILVNLGLYAWALHRHRPNAATPRAAALAPGPRCGDNGAHD
jgi:hypothetical protein